MANTVQINVTSRYQANVHLGGMGLGPKKFCSICWNLVELVVEFVELLVLLLPCVVNFRLWRDGCEGEDTKEVSVSACNICFHLMKFIRVWAVVL